VKEIPLSSKKYPGYVASVDDEDYPIVSNFSWYPSVRHHAGGILVYAKRSLKQENGRHTTQCMHTLLTGNKKTDHVDTNGLNNQRLNLRQATQSQNGANRRTGLGRSRWKGVSWDNHQNKWEARIKKDGVCRHLGRFQKEWDAAQAYNFAAEELFGEFANYNRPLEYGCEPKPENWKCSR
jgi:hypothetical protein